MYNILNTVNSPDDLKKLSFEDTLLLCSEIRSFLVDSVTKNGGHLASNLGVVELTVALHKVFDCPKDRIIFDVGHQSYVHKILTGRKDKFGTLRKENGLSGFTKRSESEYDAFGAGHSSTSLSAAVGFAEADRLLGNDSYTIAVIGDGAFTGGMIYEALNNCSRNTKLIIILNENEMSISKNVGNLSKHISRFRATKGYITFKIHISEFFDKLPVVGKPLKKISSYIKHKAKSAVYNLNIFENMGLKYLGPIDGNDYRTVEMMLREAKRRDGNVLIHMKTIKGCGFPDAVQNPEKYHGISPCDSPKSCNGTYSEHAGLKLAELADNDRNICAITAAMCAGTGLSKFQMRHPDRFFDVGIAESHAVTFMAGLSAAGLKPVFAVYSTFLQRAYDNLLHDVALQKLGGVLLVDRAGFACEDGATHHGIYDVAYLSQINGITIYEPLCYRSLEAMMEKALNDDRLYAVRYPKGGESELLCDSFEISEDNFDIKIYNPSGKPFKKLVVSYGRITEQAVIACNELEDAAVIALETLSPLDRQANLISDEISDSCEKIAFLEEGIYQGGAMMLLQGLLLEKNALTVIKSKIFAVRGEIPEQACLDSLYRICGIAAADIVDFLKD